MTCDKSVLIRKHVTNVDFGRSGYNFVIESIGSASPLDAALHCTNMKCVCVITSMELHWKIETSEIELYSLVKHCC